MGGTTTDFFLGTGGGADLLGGGGGGFLLLEEGLLLRLSLDFDRFSKELFNEVGFEGDLGGTRDVLRELGGLLVGIEGGAVFGKLGTIGGDILGGIACIFGGRIAGGIAVGRVGAGGRPGGPSPGDSPADCARRPDRY